MYRLHVGIVKVYDPVIYKARYIRFQIGCIDCLIEYGDMRATLVQTGGSQQCCDGGNSLVSSVTQYKHVRVVKARTRPMNLNSASV